jgi:DNA-binding response OmpR family regulator
MRPPGRHPLPDVSGVHQPFSLEAVQTRKRVVLVEDDASIQRFVELALEPLEIDFQVCATLVAARKALTTPPAPAVILLDGVLPDGSGFELLCDPALRSATSATRWVVFSSMAELPAVARRGPFAAFGVLAKPTGVLELLNVVERALTGPEADGDGTHAAQRATEAADTHGAEDGSLDAMAAAIELHFEGQRALFDEMARQTAEQLPEDIRRGDASIASQDARALHRLSHSLKTVLRWMGRPAAADVARQLEMNAASGWKSDLPTQWEVLRRLLMAAARTR